jgi:hypothetical protein
MLVHLPSKCEALSSTTSTTKPNQGNQPNKKTRNTPQIIFLLALEPFQNSLLQGNLQNIQKYFPFNDCQRTIDFQCGLFLHKQTILLQGGYTK